MASIVTYDIPSKHVEFKKEMFALGYKDQISGKTCKIIYFPNTTLYHPTNTAYTARVEVQKVCKKLNVELERCIATIWEDWSAICGEPFK
ncbi:hypothetical protein LZZ90_00660 [Flavobacterium sp. SM15]|uniref:hypothetical protein n=1 Tax=Flavobacterium sp. SM15 TaxID=2908005 RepID=UPI001EDBE357|nr:hypothetical protein [Flavobacterium sp. SM15]MCG2610013.1 hypothetical protein [Flavobacterium sp. SM15]